MSGAMQAFSDGRSIQGSDSGHDQEMRRPHRPMPKPGMVPRVLPHVVEDGVLRSARRSPSSGQLNVAGGGADTGAGPGDSSISNEEHAEGLMSVSALNSTTAPSVRGNRRTLGQTAKPSPVVHRPANAANSQALGGGAELPTNEQRVRNRVLAGAPDGQANRGGRGRYDVHYMR
eukprot:NODE_21209_length_764_cov_3.312402.p1 GENE.NODE_21209_length_764_cov_3.312402~~NODE_21209_length_764_cov_3.312402.p1  ORF type:complete len:174 (-),score=36.46 NODE_21209_length_764_cov_3.312402:4-525(-)